MFIHNNREEIITDHSEVSFMDELFPTRCMVSPNEF